MLRFLPVLALCVATLTAAAPPGVLDVPFVRQQKQGCGPAVVSMLLQYWSTRGGPLTEEWSPSAIYNLLYDPQSRGVSNRKMAEFLVQRGFLSFEVQGEWEDLVEQTTKGRPVVVALLPSKGQPVHFVLIVGAGGHQAILHDPERGSNITISRDSLLREWNGTSRWTMLAVPAAPQSPLKIQ